ncbi:hypothetical protein [Leptospira alexanderi]|uniref:Lipoprotein n=1 Tax=Leptospira alexanderi serovar Manhao 3 str. L 60 TaxID=1049759 RepID=V6HV13_9LEPT|nr:hypothetical protein [Leptospira alexanderi]EQA60677.1 putative lipoprotein [Leptospira alexanderi serovar Manhao 3 str. L 60]
MRLIRIIFTLLILIPSFFISCPNEKKESAVDVDTTVLLYSVMNLSKFNCADLKANTDLSQVIPFRVIGSGNLVGNFAYVYVNVTAGQKVSFTSVTSDLTKSNSISLYPGCNMDFLKNSSAILNKTTSNSKSIVYTASISFEGLIGIGGSISNFGSQPGDITVGILP